MKRLLKQSLLLAGLMLLGVNVAAHESRPAYLALTEIDPQHWQVQWKVPVRGDQRLSIYPQFSRCALSQRPQDTVFSDALVQRWQMACDEQGIAGLRVEIVGLQQTLTDTLVRIEYTDGAVTTHLLRPNKPDFMIEGERSSGEVAKEYTLLGIEHILIGIDHLLFVLALLLIVRGVGLLIKTITAFTLAHSVTLGLAALGVLNVPGPPVEASIALSIVFLANELVKQNQGHESLTSRMPWVVALTFGLLHGLGFAGALADIGLPRGDIPLALLMFNVGVELGQLIFVAAALMVIALLKRLGNQWPHWMVQVPAYSIGSIAAYWCFDRISGFVG